MIGHQEPLGSMPQAWPRLPSWTSAAPPPGQENWSLWEWVADDTPLRMLAVDDSTEELVENHWIPEAVSWVRLGYIVWATEIERAGLPQSFTEPTAAKCLIHLKLALPVHKSELSIAWMEKQACLPGGPIWTLLPSRTTAGHWVAAAPVSGTSGSVPGLLRPAQATPHARFLLDPSRPVLDVEKFEEKQRGLMMLYWEHAGSAALPVPSLAPDAEAAGLPDWVAGPEKQPLRRRAAAQGSQSADHKHPEDLVAASAAAERDKQGALSRSLAPKREHPMPAPLLPPNKQPRVGRHAEQSLHPAVGDSGAAKPPSRQVALVSPSSVQLAPHPREDGQQEERHCLQELSDAELDEFIAGMPLPCGVPLNG